MVKGSNRGIWNSGTQENKDRKHKKSKILLLRFA
jgi:hypothetical protein